MAGQGSPRQLGPQGARGVQQEAREQGAGEALGERSLTSAALQSRKATGPAQQGSRAPQPEQGQEGEGKPWHGLLARGGGKPGGTTGEASLGQRRGRKRHGDGAPRRTAQGRRGGGGEGGLWGTRGGGRKRHQHSASPRQGAQRCDGQRPRTRRCCQRGRWHGDAARCGAETPSGAASRQKRRTARKSCGGVSWRGGGGGDGSDSGSDDDDGGQSSGRALQALLGRIGSTSETINTVTMTQISTPLARPNSAPI